MGQRILTNKYGLPATLVKAVELDTHVTKGDISCTTLIDAPQIRKLKEANDYEVDVVDQLYALMGTALHHILERANISDVRKRAFITTASTIMDEADRVSKLEGFEKQADQLRKGANWIFSLIPVMFPEIADRYVFEITVTLHIGNKTVSCTFDLYDRIDCILYDYKFCSTFSYIIPESRHKWDEQTNIYAFALETEKQLPVKAIRVVAFFRDWSKYKYMQDPANYPSMQIMEINVRRRTNQEILGLINYHLERHNKADAGHIEECNGVERWAEADAFAVKVGKNKRAKRVFDNRPDADRFITDNQISVREKLWVEFRPGSSKRCEEYCVVSSVCPQFAREKKRKEEEAKLIPIS